MLPYPFSVSAARRFAAILGAKELPTLAARAVGAKTVQAESHELAQIAEVQPVLCNNIEPGATPQVSPPHKESALQAQKQCKPSAMSLLRWPRRSLFYVTVTVGVTSASTPMAEKMVGVAMGISNVTPVIVHMVILPNSPTAQVLGIPMEVTPTATAAPTARK